MASDLFRMPSSGGLMVYQFATVEDYENRYGEYDDSQQLQILLDDASAFIAGQPGFDFDWCDELKLSNLVRVTCAIVHRALSAGEWAGLSNVSQGAGGYSASATVYNPGEDFYITKAERRTIGLGVARIGGFSPFQCCVQSESSQSQQSDDSGGSNGSS